MRNVDILNTESVHFASRLPWDFMTDNDQKWGYLYAKYQSSTANIKHKPPLQLTRKIKSLPVSSRLFKQETQGTYKYLHCHRLDNLAIRVRLPQKQEIYISWDWQAVRAAWHPHPGAAAEACNLVTYFSSRTTSVMGTGWSFLGNKAAGAWSSPLVSI
jgi:hypothetical protein